nr:hypothetical protein GCM10020093_111190 [Planobispora longispora]
MTRALLALDLALTVLVAGFWLGAGITVAVRQEGPGGAVRSSGRP